MTSQTVKLPADKAMTFDEFCALPLGSVYNAHGSVWVVNQTTKLNLQTISDDAYGRLYAYLTPDEFNAYPVQHDAGELEVGRYWLFALNDDGDVDDSFFYWHSAEQKKKGWTNENGFKAIPVA